MANTGFKGVDVRQTGNQLVFRASLKDSAGAKVTTGTTSLYLYELQSDGTLKSYDFNDNTFKTTALTTATASMTHRQGNNSTTDTGIWTYALSTLTGFTVGAVYFAVVTNTGATPDQQEREFQYGSAQGDLVVTANGTGIGEMNSDLKMANGTAVTLDANNVLNVSTKYIAGSSSAANKQRDAALSVYSGTVTGSPTTSGFIDTAFAEGDDDWVVNRQIVFLAGSTMEYQQSTIIAYNHTTKAFTVSPLFTRAPTTGDAYDIL